MAGLDGITRSLDPIEMGYTDEDNASHLPENLKEAALALRAKHDYLLVGAIFTQKVIDQLVEMELDYYRRVNRRPHPYELSLYESI